MQPRRSVLSCATTLHNLTCTLLAEQVIGPTLPWLHSARFVVLCVCCCVISVARRRSAANVDAKVDVAFESRDCFNEM